MPGPAFTTIVTIMARTAIIMPITEAIPEDVDGQQALLDLLTWSSPAWPIGAFAFSGGLEWACDAGFLPDADSAFVWIETLVANGPIWNDAVFFVHAHRAALAGNDPALLAIAELAQASTTSAERRLETIAQGAAFRRIARSTLGAALLAPLDAVKDVDIAYPVVFGCLAARRDVPIEPALGAFLQGVVANLVSAVQRLVPLGQTDAQKILFALRPGVRRVTARAVALPADDPLEQIGGATLVADLGTMAHETQYTRLFRT